MKSVDLDLMKRLIAFDTISAKSNLSMAQFIGEYCEAHGGSVQRCFSADGGKVNLLITKGAQMRDGSGLALCGHMDVVPAGEQQWQSDPFELVQRDGRLVARGSCDMKGFVTLALQVFAEADDKLLNEPLALLLTYDEELGSLGVKRLLEDTAICEALPRSIIIGEPTSLRAVRMHKGHLKLRIRITGRAAHSGSPHLGINAISAAACVIAAIDELSAQLAQERSPVSSYFPEAPFVVLAPVRIHGGEALNIIPEACWLDLSVRLLPGMESANVISRIEAAISTAKQRDAIATVEIIDDNPPMLTADDAPLNRALMQTINQDQTIGVSFASDGGRLAQLGCECVLFGPGSIDVAHRPNEYVAMTEMQRAAEVLHTMIRRVCMNGEVDG